MGTLGTLERTFLGAAFYTSIVGFVGVCIYTSIFCRNNNPWLSYEPKRVGQLGAIAYVIAVSSIFSACLYIVAFILIILRHCHFLKIVFSAIATVVALVCMICEIIFISWGNWSLEPEVIDSIEDDPEFQNYAQQFLTGVKPAYYDYQYSNRTGIIMFGMPSLGLRSPPTYGKILAKVADGSNITTKEIGMPVCVFKTKADKEIFKAEKCIGDWTGMKLKLYMKELYEKLADDKEDQKLSEDEQRIIDFKWTKANLILYSQIGSYCMISIFFGIQICALLFGLAYLALSLSDLYCGCNNDTENNLEVNGHHT